MDIAIHHHEGVCVVKATGRIDTVTAKTFGERLAGLIEGGVHRLVIDLAQVAYISSAGFRSLLVAARKLESAEGRLALAGLNGEVRRLFDIAALTEFFPMHPSAEEAVSKLASATGGRADTGGSDPAA